MSTRSLVILVVLGVVAIAGGWYFGTATLPPEQSPANNGKLMFPDLAQRLQQAVKVEVIHQGKPLVIEKREAAGRVRWGLASRAGYPVQEAKLRGMLTALTELRLLDKRTSDPSQFATLGVGDPNAPTSDAALLRVLDAAGQPIVALIVGHRRVRNGNVPPEVYVRRPNDKQSWLAEGDLQVDSDPQLWLDRDIMNIDHSRIAKVVATRGISTLEFTRANDKLTLTAPADHPKLDDYKIEDVSRALELLTFDDVRPDSTLHGVQIGKSVFTTSDGLTVIVMVYAEPPAATPTLGTETNDVMVQFSVNGDGKAKSEADRLQARLAGWIYELGSWKQSSLVPSLAELQAAPLKPAAAPAGSAVKP